MIGKERKQMEKEVGCERNNSADCKVSEERGKGVASSVRAEIPLQPMGKTVVNWQETAPLQPMEVLRGANGLLQLMEDTTLEQMNAPEGGCGCVGSPSCSRVLPKGCSSLLLKSCSPWEGPVLKKSAEECHPWDGPHSGAGDKEEGAAQATCDKLTTTLILLSCGLLQGRRC